MIGIHKSGVPLTLIERNSFSPLIDIQDELDDKKGFTSFHAFRLDLLKKHDLLLVHFKEGYDIGALQPTDTDAVSMPKPRLQAELDHFAEIDSEGEKRSLSLSSNTSSGRSIHTTPSSPATPQLVTSEVNNKVESSTEPFPDYYESCEQDVEVVNKELEQAYNNAISKVFEETVRISQLETWRALARVTTVNNQADPQCYSTTQPLPTGTTPLYKATQVPAFVPHTTSIRSIGVQTDSLVYMSPAPRSRAAYKDASTQDNQFELITPFAPDEVSIRPVAHRTSSCTSDCYNPPAISAAVYTRSESSASSSYSRLSGGSVLPSPALSEPDIYIHTSEHRNKEQNQPYETSMATSQSSLFNTQSNAEANTKSSSLLSAFPRLSGGISQNKALAIDEIVTPNDPLTPNLQPPIGTGRPKAGATHKPTETDIQRREALEQRLNTLEEIKIILRTNTLNTNIQRRFTTMTHLILRMEWIISRRPRNTSKRANDLSPQEVQELAFPIIEYLVYLDAQLRDELSATTKVLDSVIDTTKNNNLSIYQRFHKQAQIIISNLKQTHPLEKHLLTVFQSLYKSFLATNFPTQLNSLAKPTDAFTLLMAGWTLLSRIIASYEEVLAIHRDLMPRF